MSLILIRHAHSAQNPNLPAHQWGLSGRGIAQCADLVKRVANYAPSVILTSDEPKAMQTGELVAEQLGVACRIYPDLHEHRRETAAWFERVEDFETTIKQLFDRPDDLVFGEETATAALKRFSAAIDRALAEYLDQRVAIVSHGTVIALYVARKTNQAAYPFWKTLQMPDMIVLPYE